MSLRNSVVDLSRWSPPTRNVRGPDGEIVVEKLGPNVAMKVIDAAGNVTRMSLSNGISNRDRRDPYGAQLAAEKLHGRPRARKGTPGGMLPYGRCPQVVDGAENFLPRSVRGRPKCLAAADGNPIGDEHACQCIVDTIAHRQREQAERAAAVERRLEPQIARDARAQAETTVATLDKLAQIAADLAAATKGKRGKGDS